MLYVLERLDKDKSHKKNAIELVWKGHVEKTRQKVINTLG